jgi:hypothetical protein
MKNKSDTLWQVSVSILVFTTLIVITSMTIVDADLWGHLRFGLDNLEAGQVLQVDPYSYLSGDQRWINHEWLAEVLFALSWLGAGSTGLILLKTVVGVLTLGMIYLYLIRREVSHLVAGSLVLVTWLGIFPAIATIRPHMFTILFAGITFIIIAKAEWGKYRWLWAAPIIFMLWVNSHGGFLAGLSFLGIWAVVHTVLHRQELLRIVPPVLISFLSVLINPYGLDLIIFLLRTTTVPRPEIVEWQPLNLVSFLGATYLILLTITILSIVISRREKRIPLLILLVVAALLPFIAVRHLPLFSLAVLLFAGEHIADAILQIRPAARRTSKRPISIIILSLLIAIGLLIFSYRNFLRIPIPNQPDPFFPDKAVALLKDSAVTGNLAVEFNWGEYVIWHLGPGIQVSVDGRRETVYSDDIYKTNFSFLYGIHDWDSIINNYDTHVVLVKKSQGAYNLMRMKQGWELLYEDNISALFARQDWDSFDSILQTANNFTPPPDASEFP